MAELPSTQLWTGRAVFLALGIGIIFLQLVPLSMEPVRWAPPDYLLALVAVWAIRRPDYAPLLAVVGLMLLADLLFQRPPGLWAALVVIMSEMLRARAKRLRNVALAAEWATAAVAIIITNVMYRIILVFVMVPLAPLGLTLIQLVMTIAIYPVVAIAAHLVFGVTRPAPGAVDSLGHRL